MREGLHLFVLPTSTPPH